MTKLEELRRRKRRLYKKMVALDAEIEQERRRRMRSKAKRVADAIIGLFNGTIPTYMVNSFPKVRLGVEFVFKDSDGLSGTRWVDVVSKESPLFEAPERTGRDLKPKVALLPVILERVGKGRAVVNVSKHPYRIFRSEIVEQVVTQLGRLRCDYKEVHVMFNTYLGLVARKEGRRFKAVRRHK